MFCMSEICLTSNSCSQLVGNLYFTNALSTQSLLEVCRLDGRYRLVLLQDTASSLTEVAVNPILR